MPIFNNKIAFVATSIMLPVMVMTGCGSDDTTTSNVEVVSETETDTELSTSTSGNYKSALFDTAPLSEEQVSCELENGSTTTCYLLTFASNTVGDTEGDGTIGPYCPPTIDTLRSESGVGIYDGTTTPGFQSLVDAAIAMDTDGYDIVDEEGNIRSSDLTQGSEVEGFSYCLSANFDSTLTVSYLIPVTPQLRTEAYVLGTIDSLGVDINGIPIKANPPSVTVAEEGVGGTGSGNIPALDLCGGHADPAGYYHWHFIPQSINTVYASENYNYTESYDMTCSNSFIDFDTPSAFAGLAKDGFPIYGAYDLVDDVDTQPADVLAVDECNGHEHVTPEFPDGVYHYHALEGEAPNLPSCLKGSFVERDVRVR
jgi:hypothetical protein